jgi:hypothetical protein
VCFHEQVLQLNIHFSFFNFYGCQMKENQRHIFWAAWAENNSFKSKAINYPLDKNEPATAQCLIDWKKQCACCRLSCCHPPVCENYSCCVECELIAGVETIEA